MTALGKLLRGGRPWASRQHWAEEGKRNFAAHVLNDLYGPPAAFGLRVILLILCLCGSRWVFFIGLFYEGALFGLDMTGRRSRMKIGSPRGAFFKTHGAIVGLIPSHLRGKIHKIRGL